MAFTATKSNKKIRSNIKTTPVGFATAHFGVESDLVAMRATELEGGPVHEPRGRLINWRRAGGTAEGVNLNSPTRIHSTGLRIYAEIFSRDRAGS